VVVLLFDPATEQTETPTTNLLHSGMTNVSLTSTVGSQVTMGRRRLAALGFGLGACVVQAFQPTLFTRHQAQPRATLPLTVTHAVWSNPQVGVNLYMRLYHCTAEAWPLETAYHNGELMQSRRACGDAFDAQRTERGHHRSAIQEHLDYFKRIEGKIPPETTDQPSVIIGKGALGKALGDMGLGGDVLLGRGEAIPETVAGFKGEPLSSFPIYVCVPPTEVEAVIQSCPKEKRLVSGGLRSETPPGLYFIPLPQNIKRITGEQSHQCFMIRLIWLLAGDRSPFWQSYGAISGSSCAEQDGWCCGRTWYSCSGSASRGCCSGTGCAARR
jgi:hypothetical protein